MNQTSSQLFVNKPGSSIYYACLFLTPEQRKQLAPLIQFIWRVERIPRFSQETDIINSQLHWWQKEIAEALSNQSSHPILIELFSAINRLKENQPDKNLTQRYAHFLVDYLRYQVTYQQDCQLDSEHALSQHAAQKRTNLIKIAEELLSLKPLTETALNTASELLTRLDVVDGFHKDAASGIISIPLESLIKHHLTINDITQAKNNTQQFWNDYSEGISQLYIELWKHPPNPLLEVMLIYAGLRLIAFKKSLKNKPTVVHNCYNQRPFLSPLQKFWYGWRIHSGLSSTKPPLRILLP